MSKRESDTVYDGTPSKLLKEDMDDGGGGRIGRVRKKSAKVLEMEEFEQAEKTHNVVKKGKPSKGLSIFPSSSEMSDIVPEGDSLSAKKLKTSKALSAGLVPVMSHGESKPEPVIAQQSITSVDDSPSAATLTNLMVSSMSGGKQEPAPEITPDSGQTATPAKGDDQRSVIKYLLSSPSAGSKLSASNNALTKLSPTLVRPSVEASATPVVGKKSAKKPKSQEKSLSKTHPHKEKKVKTDALSPTLNTVAPIPCEFPKLKVPAPSLKMKILSSTDPSAAQVSLSTQSGPEGSKPKKSAKKVKQALVGGNAPDSITIASGAEVEPRPSETRIPKKPGPKKGFKKKEKLIQDAISAAQQTPNLAALISSQGTLSGQSSQIGLTSPTTKKATQKSQKKKTKAPLQSFASETPGDISMRGDLPCDEDAEEESHLVIAGIEKEKKKTVSKKKSISPKDKPPSDSKLEKAAKKLPKRAPTAYMLFCNTHRPTIVSDNPGIEFAGISRKLGEMWQMLSNKQKLQWRRKAQRRMKKGSNLISTGKGGKETSAATAGSAAVALPQSSQGVKLSILQKSPRSGSEDTPQSPTKNFSIEPIDVAAHLKLLGESLSIIGMRLQEHKGMIAVQGSLSVLLDSLLCSCGPLLCLTQQIPGMDGCSPLVHGKTLDSVAYVMPGL